MNQKAKTILRPLFIWTFIEALIFWYAVEKLLLHSVGISPSQIILLGIIAQSSQVLIEVPSSIVADRWSRRKTLILSSVCMLVAICIVLVVQSFLAFMIMFFVWACYFAFRSGTINAYVYDLLKEQGEQSQYRKAISRQTTLELSGLLISSLLASVFVEWGNFLTPYWITLIPSTISILLLWRMRDPVIKRTEQSMGSALHHVKSAFRSIHTKKWLSIIFIALAFITAGRFIWFEYYQLYAIQHNILPVLFGLILALIHAGNILGAEFAHRIKNPNLVLVIALLTLLSSNVALIFVSDTVAIITFLVTCFFGSQACSIIFDESLQHQTRSELRATTLSLAGLASRVIFGIAALAVIAVGTSPKTLAVATLVAFLCVAIYIPVRKRLVSAEDELASITDPDRQNL